jgi:hypothetical protein
MAQLSQISDIIEEIKKQNENETKGQLSRLEIIFMEILQVLKTNLEDAKKRAALERTFQEEKDYEDERKHKQFIDVLKNFVSMQPLQQLEEKKETEKGGGFLDLLKNFIKGLVTSFTKLIKRVFNLVKKVAIFALLLSKKLISVFRNIWKFMKAIPWLKLIKHPNVIKFLKGLRAGTPLALLLGGIYAGSELLNEAVKRVPDFSKIDYKQAENVLISGNQRDIEYFSNKLPSEYVDRPELQSNEPDISSRTKLELYVRDAKKQRISDLQRKFDREDTLSDKEQAELNILQNEPIVPIVTPTQLPNVPPRPAEGGANARANAWDRKFGATHNRDGTPKKQTASQPLEQFNVSPSTIGSGRGGEAEYVDYLARQLESTGQTGAFFGGFRIASGKKSDTSEKTIHIGDTPPANQDPNKLTYTEPTSTAIHIGDTPPANQDPNKLTYAELKTDKKIPDDNSYTMPLPSKPSVRIEKNTHEKVISPEESLRRFINQNNALHLRNELKSMALEYEELGRILKGTSNQPIKPETTPSPISQMLNNATIANNDLVLRNMFTIDDQVINNVSNNGRTEVLPDTPMPVEASQRDDTYTLTTVLNRYKKTYV